jgi:hypothetical protein
MPKLRHTVSLILCGCLASAAPASADPVSDWNAIASTTALAAGAREPGTAPLLDLAMVHAAIHDAVQAYEKRFKPYAAEIRNASGSRAVAVAKAAHDVLADRFPAQAATLLGMYETYLVSHSLPINDAGGERVGSHAADAIIALRENDGSNPTPPPGGTGGTGAGQWRPTPPGFGQFAASWLGAIPPFTMEFAAQFHARPHPALTSRQYARAYNEVKALGGPVGYPGVTRDADQTQLAFFYSDNLLALYQRTLRGIVEACETGAGGRHCSRLDRLGDTARLFALANLAAADAAIASWENKATDNLWRPITAIQQILPADNDGNPLTEADATWTSLLPTPPYPEYTSGANNLSGSITTILARFFGTDKVGFRITSNATLANPKFRDYERFSDAADDMVDVRVYQGIHFRFADTAGRRQGTRIAKQAFNHFLRPVHERDHKHDDDCDGRDDDEDDEDDENDHHGRGRDRRD